MWNVFTTLRRPADAPDDPWDGYTLEWATTSPPPVYNFDHAAAGPLRAARVRPQATAWRACRGRGRCRAGGEPTDERGDASRADRARDRDRPGAARPRRGMDTALLGMLLFIASEVMFFAALFGVYFNVRATTNPWPPEGTEFISWQGTGCSASASRCSSPSSW